MRLYQSLLSYLIRRAARAHGFLDPLTLLAQLAQFGQPSEVMVPTELLRSGALLQARGLINSQAIQHNLDWVWPYWVERQFNPRDPAFIPRAFQLTHINLTHRNWTAVGLPDQTVTPIVDPRGLVTPLWDGWSIDCWVVDADGPALYPSRAGAVRQELHWDGNLSVSTAARGPDQELETRVSVERAGTGLVCRITGCGRSQSRGWLVVALRPYNPEGVSFIQDIERLADTDGWLVNKQARVIFSAAPETYHFSDYRSGDVAGRLADPATGRKVACRVGMATAAACFALPPRSAREVTVDIPLAGRPVGRSASTQTASAPRSWDQAVAGAARLEIPDPHYKQLYEAGLRTMILHTAGESLAGPYTYKRFWFRDAVFVAQALLCAGLTRRAWAVIERFPRRQTPSGYFSSQDGEWDSNGQVLWLLQRYAAVTGQALDQRWQEVVQRAAGWILRKRLPDQPAGLHAGLMPPGFSAEHLGPSDYYYWDNFWSVAGLRAAAELLARCDQPEAVGRFQEAAAALLAAIERSLTAVRQRLGTAAVPAAPSRRMDSGAIGSLAAGYPLQVWGRQDPRLLGTVEYLLGHCLVNGGFFHDMSHSGINPYLTLHLAQVLLRAGDGRFADLMAAIAGLASSTGQWPEAVHPATRGGCMGDGQHVWAAAEWVMMVRNCFVREDREGASLVLGSGVVPSWYAGAARAAFGPAPTAFGPLRVAVGRQDGDVVVEWDGQWHHRAPRLEIRVPGFPVVTAADGQRRVVLGPAGGAQCVS